MNGLLVGDWKFGLGFFIFVLVRNIWSILFGFFIYVHFFIILLTIEGVWVLCPDCVVGAEPAAVSGL